MFLTCPQVSHLFTCSSPAPTFLTCPVEPVPLELLSVVPLEDLVDADDVARGVCGRLLVRWVHGRPGNRCHLPYITIIKGQAIFATFH